MISMRLRRLKRHLSCLMGMPRDVLPGDAGLYSFVFQRISEPASVIAPVGQQPFRLRQTAEQNRRASLVADLACGHQEAERAAFSVGNSMLLGVHATLGSADRTAPLVAWHTFFDRGLVAVQCAFR